MCVRAQRRMRVFHVKHEGGAAYAPTVSRETHEKLNVYAGLLLRWNARINLVGRNTEADLWRRHFEDSLQLAKLMPAGTDRAIDFGSGAGFPGLVLAIATGVRFDLVESDVRKAAFLREVAAATAAPVDVHAVRIERAGLAPAGLVMARALAPLGELLSLVFPMMTKASVALFPKGAAADRELTDAQARWHMQVERHQSVTDPHGVILRLTEVRRA